MKNVPAPLSCAIAAHPGLAYLFFPLIAPTLPLFAWPDLADAKRMGGEGSFGSKPSYNSDYNKQAPPAKDSPAMAQQATPNARPASVDLAACLAACSWVACSTRCFSEVAASLARACSTCSSWRWVDFSFSSLSNPAGRPRQTPRPMPTLGTKNLVIQRLMVDGGSSVLSHKHHRDPFCRKG